MRYVMNSPWHWTEELSGLLMAWIVFIGVYNAERDRENLTIDFFVQIFNKHTRKLIAIIITLVSVFLLFLTAYWGWGQAEAVQLRKTRIMRSEEHTSELQSRGHLVCRLLLEKKK